jgi:hypothetical protein
MGASGPVGAFLNGMSFHDAPATEYPTLGTTEMWEVVNLTGDTHPIHLHLVQFQLLNRQKVKIQRYEHAFMQANPEMPAETYTEVPVTPYLRGKPTPADPNERGWKDTFRMNPGEVTRVLVRFAPQDESPAFAFDATAEPGYVWHCHILEHEENDMMRPYHLVAGPPPIPELPLSVGPVPAAVTVEATTLSAVNPLAAGSLIRFTLRNAGPVRLDLFNVSGERVERLADGWFEAGEHSLPWPSLGSLGSGMYFLKLEADGVDRTQKVVLAR